MYVLVVYCGNQPAQTDAETVAANMPQIYIECGRAARVMCIFYCVLTWKSSYSNSSTAAIAVRRDFVVQAGFVWWQHIAGLSTVRSRGLKRHVVNLTSSVHEICLLVSRRTERRSLL
jgi:hypothetical protein